jgi:hypothetical protein
MKWPVAVALFVGSVGIVLVPTRPALAQVAIVPAASYTQGVPVNKTNKPLVQAFSVYNATTKKYVTLTASVVIPPIMPAMKGPPPVPAETPAEASQRKAMALVDALNMQITNAINLGTLPAGTPMFSITTQPATLPAFNAFGQPVDARGIPIAISGNPQAQIPNRLAGFAIVQLPAGNTYVAKGSSDPTGEPKTAGGPGGGVGPIPPPPPPRMGSMGGGGASMGDAEGGDPISFGFFDTEGLNANCMPSVPNDLASLPLLSSLGCPGDYIATIDTTPGEDDENALSALAEAFDADFESQGFTASYNPATDLLTLDQPLLGYSEVYAGDLDPGLNFYAQAPIPEPSSVLFLGAGLIGLRILRQRARGHSSHW